MSFRILALDGGGIKGLAPRGQYSLDAARPEQIERLIALGRGEAMKSANMDVIRARFLNGQHAPPFIPCTMSRDVKAPKGNAVKDFLPSKLGFS